MNYNKNANGSHPSTLNMEVVNNGTFQPLLMEQENGGGPCRRLRLCLRRFRQAGSEACGLRLRVRRRRSAREAARRLRRRQQVTCPPPTASRRACARREALHSQFEQIDFLT